MTKLLIMILTMTILGALGSFYFKKSSNNNNLLNFNLFFGGLLYTLGMIINILALKYYDYTVVFPLTSLTYVWSFILGAKILNEKFNRYNVYGVCLIICGVMVLGIS